MATAANVVTLPTAAARKVQQPCNKASRAETVRLRALTAWPGEYPGERAIDRAFLTYQEQREKRLAKLEAIHDRATLAIVVAMFDTLDADARFRTRCSLLFTGKQTNAEGTTVGNDRG